MENYNRDSNNARPESEKRPAAQRYRPSSNVAAISREKLVILMAMFAFAFVLFSIVLLVILLGKSGGDSNGDKGDLHRHDYSYTIELVDGKFNLLAKCNNEGCDVPEYKESDIKDVVLSAETLPTCTAEGSKTYSTTKDGTTVTYVEKLGALGHKLNGVDVATLKNENGYVVYDGTNINVSSDVVLACNGTYDQGGSFNCSACKEKVDVAFYVPHLTGKDGGSAEWVTVKEATCTEEGIQSLHCNLCNDSMAFEQAIPALGHKINGVSVFEMENENGYLVYDGKNLTVSSGLTILCNTLYKDGGAYTCSACKENVITTFFVSHAKIEDPKPEDWVILEGNQSTCAKKGKESLRCKCGGAVTEERVLPLLDHKINGVSVSEYKDENGRIIYDETYIKLPSNIMCGEEEIGEYKCSECLSKCFHLVKIPHIAKDRENEDNWVIQTEATCTVEGKKVLCCKFCNTEVMETQKIPAGHSFVDSLSIDGDVINLVTKCEKDCGEPQKIADVTSLVRVESHTPGTCGKREETVYAYDYGDGRDPLTVTKYGTFLKDGHVFNFENQKPDGTFDYIAGQTIPLLEEGESFECGTTVKNGFGLLCTECSKVVHPITVHVPEHNFVVDYVMQPTLKKTGSVTLKCTNSDWGCTHTVKNIVLPKIVFGEVGSNAVRGENKDGFVPFYYKVVVKAEGIDVEVSLVIWLDEDIVPPVVS